jgi:hypothetical protein
MAPLSVDINLLMFWTDMMLPLQGKRISTVVRYFYSHFTELFFIYPQQSTEFFVNAQPCKTDKQDTL